MDLQAVRQAGQRVLERGRFSARTAIDVPDHGIRSTSMHAVDLHRGLARVATTFTMGPAAVASTSWTPRGGDPVVHWVVGDHLVMQLADQDGSRRWISLPDTPLLSSELSLLLWPAGVVEASTAHEGSAAISAVVDLGEVVDRAPTVHADGAAHFIAAMALAAGDAVAVELTLTAGALRQIDVDSIVIDAEEGPIRRLVHLAVEPDVAAPLGDPPHPQDELDANELVRALEVSPSGGLQWWTRTRPFRP